MISPLLPFGIAALAVLLRLPYARIDIENNTGSYLYYGQFRRRGVRFHHDVGTCGAVAMFSLYALLYDLLGRRWAFRWTRVAGAAFNGLTALGVWIAADRLVGPEGALVAGLAFAIISNVPHLIPWFTCPEWYFNAFIAGGVALMLAEGPTPSPWAFLAAGLLAGIAAQFKVSALLPALAIPAYHLLAGSGGLAARIALVSIYAAGAATPWLLHILQAFREGTQEQYTVFLDLIRRYKRADRAKRNSENTPGLFRNLWTHGLDVARGTSPVLVAPLALVAAAATGAALPQGTGLVATWAILAFGSMAAQGVFSPGHWAPLVPPLAVLHGLAVHLALDGGDPWAGAAIAASTAAGLLAAWLSGRTHKWSLAASTALQDGWRDLAGLVEARTAPSERILVWGWHPQVYNLADRIAFRLDYCSESYLDLSSAGWRLRYLRGFIEQPPAYLVTTYPQHPLLDFALLSGLGYTYDPSFSADPRAGQIVAYRLTERTARHERLASAQDPVAAAIEEGLARCRRAMAAGDPGGAADFGRAILAVYPEHPEVIGLSAILAPCLEEDQGMRLSLEFARDGALVGRCEVGGREVDLHHPLDPRGEAAVAADRLDVAGAGVVLVFGVGLGYHVREVLRRQRAGATVVIVERWHRLAEQARLVSGLPAPGEMDHVRWLVCSNPALAARALRDLYDRRIVAMFHEPSRALAGAYYGAVASAIQADAAALARRTAQHAI